MNSAIAIAIVIAIVTDLVMAMLVHSSATRKAEGSNVLARIRGINDTAQALVHSAFGHAMLEEEIEVRCSS